MRIEIRYRLKDCGTGAGGFQPGNTCGEVEGSGEDRKNEVRQSARSQAERLIANYELSQQDSETFLKAIDDGLFDDLAVDPKSPEDISTLTENPSARVDSFVQKAKSLIDKMPSIERATASEAIIDTMLKSQESLGVSRIDANIGTPDQNLSFAAETLIETNIAQAMYADRRPGDEISFLSGGSSQQRLDQANALGAFDGSNIRIDSKELSGDPVARSAVIAHELAHAQHNPTKPDRSLSDMEQAIADRDGMRPYGYSSSSEYVAVFNEMISRGHKFGNAAWSLYDEFEGPAHRDAFRKARTK